MSSVIHTFIVVAVIILSTFLIIYQQQYIYDKRIFEIAKIKGTHLQKASSCDINCNSIDPVSDPKYNMQQIVKQSILLEEHLANKNKRCRDCITKHFLHIIGLAEEAQMLATNKINDYPLVNESVILYNDLFHKWIEHNDITDEKNILYCMDKLRDNRKNLIVIYFFNEKYKIKKEV